MARSTKVWADFTEGYSPAEPINWWAAGLATVAAVVLSLLALAIPFCSGHSQLVDAIMKMSFAFAGSGITVSGNCLSPMWAVWSQLTEPKWFPFLAGTAYTKVLTA